jgi:hypothetical protein
MKEILNIILVLILVTGFLGLLLLGVGLLLHYILS